MPTKEKLIFSFVKISALLSILAIYFARSEGALVAILVATLFIAFFIEPFSSFGKMRGAMTALLLVGLVLILLTPVLYKTLENRLLLNDFSGQIRKAQWRETAVMLRDGHVFWGAGLATYQEKMAPYHQNGIYIRNDDADFDERIKADPEYQAIHWQPLEIFLYPHNIFLNFWVELGIMGLLLFMWLIIKSFYLGLMTLFKETDVARRFLILAPLAALLVTTIHGIVDVPYFKNDLAIVFWLLLAVVGLLSMIYKKSSVNEKEVEVK